MTAAMIKQPLSSMFHLITTQCAWFTWRWWWWWLVVVASAVTQAQFCHRRVGEEEKKINVQIVVDLARSTTIQTRPTFPQTLNCEH